MMGLQFGVLARLTWWEYSWDIMEPVTYFVTYGTTIAMYAYYVCTKQVIQSLVTSRLTYTKRHFVKKGICFLNKDLRVTCYRLFTSGYKKGNVN